MHLGGVMSKTVACIEFSRLKENHKKTNSTWIQRMDRESAQNMDAAHRLVELHFYGARYAVRD